MTHAAEQGNVLAHYRLGIAYSSGYGVRQDDREALYWHKQAADQGLSLAHHNIGVMYYEGKGVDRNYREAFAWYLKAAQLGHAETQNNVGAMYFAGKGVQKDWVRAHMGLHLSAIQGNSSAYQAIKYLEEQMTPEQIQKAYHLDMERKSKDKQGRTNGFTPADTGH